VTELGKPHHGPHDTAALAQTSLEDFDRVVAVNARAPFLTTVATIEFAAREITVNAVAQGSTATGPFAQLTAGQRSEAGSAFALGRIGEPADTAAVVAFLASADAGFVTGQVSYAAGGQRGPISRAG
jgi:NAD(P)-dependent dehydrogenase (short-subunit alcohol dehydrogenase family)